MVEMNENIKIRGILEYFLKVHNTEYSLPQGGLKLKGDPLFYFLTGRYSKEFMSSPVFISGHPIDIIGRYVGDLFSENKNGRRTENLYDSRILFLAEDTRNNGSYNENEINFRHNSCPDKRIVMPFEVYFENNMLRLKGDFSALMPQFIAQNEDFKKLKKKKGFLEELQNPEHKLNLPLTDAKNLVNYLF